MSARLTLLEDLVAAANCALPAIVELRRRFHRWPETGLNLPETQAALVADLQGLGLAPQLGTGLSSVVVVVEGDLPGPTILLRADMDALSLPEETGLEFASRNPDVMHACGHDTHMAMLLGGIRLLLMRRSSLRGRALCMFQPGEEDPGGAMVMLREGILSATDPAPTGAFALHITARDPVGVITTRSGPMMASSDVIKIRINGRGGHASAPHLALDPVPIAAELILALQSLVTRTINVFDPVVLTVSHLKAGYTDNIIPEAAFLEGTLRTLSEGVRTETKARIRKLAVGLCAAHGAAAHVEIVEGYPVTFNNPGFTTWAVRVARTVLGEDAVRQSATPEMAAEDFSYVLQKIPGAMFFLGARPSNVDLATAPMNHSNKVVFDERALVSGAALYAAAALAYADYDGS